MAFSRRSFEIPDGRPVARNHRSAWSTGLPARRVSVCTPTAFDAEAPDDGARPMAMALGALGGRPSSASAGRGALRSTDSPTPCFAVNGWPASSLRRSLLVGRVATGVRSSRTTPRTPPTKGRANPCSKPGLPGLSAAQPWSRLPMGSTIRFVLGLVDRASAVVRGLALTG